MISDIKAVNGHWYQMALISASNTCSLIPMTHVSRFNYFNCWPLCLYVLYLNNITHLRNMTHDDVIKWKHFWRYWPFLRGIHRSPVNSPHKGQWRGVLMFSFICAWINCWVNNREAGAVRRQRAHYDVIVMNNPTNMVAHQVLFMVLYGYQHQSPGAPLLT